MTEFYLVVGALVLFAGLFVLFPVLQVRGGESSTRQAANVQLFRERQLELDELLGSGNLERAEYDVLTIELQRRVLEEADKAEGQSASAGRPQWLAGVIIVVGMGILAGVMYQFTGYKADWDITQTLEDARAKVAAGQEANAERQQLLAQLASRLEERPEEFFYWMLKGNIEMEMARLQESVDTFEHLSSLLPGDTAVMAKLLEARYLRDRGQLDANSQSLAASILTADPNNVRTLGLLGIHSFESRQYGQAIEYWQQLLPLVGPFSPNGKMISQGIERARVLLAEQSGTKAGIAPPGQSSLIVNVSLAEHIRAQGDASVFVYARAANGPRMPLAVQRLTVADLPARITLDDSMAMAPGMTLSSVDQVEVVARISSQGIANRSSGDMEGSLGPLTVGAAAGPVDVVINEILP